jgi:hypothetical protein
MLLDGGRGGSILYNVSRMLFSKTCAIIQRRNARDFERGTKWGPNPLKTLGRAGKMPVEQP